MRHWSFFFLQAVTAAVFLMVGNARAVDPSPDIVANWTSIGSPDDLKIWFYLDIRNKGISPVTRNRISIKYWFTFEKGNKISLNYTSAIDANVEFTPVTDREGVDTVAKITFGSPADIAPGSGTGQIEMQYMDDWRGMNQNERNDYSFRLSDANRSRPNNRMTVYYDGKLVYGIEPPLRQCLNNIRNDNETDIDCGGVCSAACIDGQGCIVDGDCRSNNCRDGRCKNIDEEDDLEAATTNIIDLSAHWASIGSPDDLKIWFYLDIRNNGTIPVERNRISVRYWFTFEKGNKISLNYINRLDTAVRFIPVADFEGVDMVAEITFTNAVNIPPGGGTSPIEVQCIDDWRGMNQNELNDYSYRSADPMVLSPNNRMTVYYDGILVYGIEPPLKQGLR